MTKRQHVSLFTVIYGVIVCAILGAVIVPIILVERAAQTERALNAVIQAERTDSTRIFQELRQIKAAHPPLQPKLVKSPPAQSKTTVRVPPRADPPLVYGPPSPPRLKIKGIEIQKLEYGVHPKEPD